MKKTFLTLLSICLSIFFMTSCESGPKKGEADKFPSLQEIGIYNGGEAFYLFNELEDQLSTTSNYPPSLDIRFQNSLKKFAYSIKGIPSGASEGTEFTLTYIEHIPDAENKISEMQAEIIKIENGKAWIKCKKEGKGFIINY